MRPVTFVVVWCGSHCVTLCEHAYACVFVQALCSVCLGRPVAGVSLYLSGSCVCEAPVSQVSQEHFSISLSLRKTPRTLTRYWWKHRTDQRTYAFIISCRKYKARLISECAFMNLPNTQTAIGLLLFVLQPYSWCRCVCVCVREVIWMRFCDSP